MKINTPPGQGFFGTSYTSTHTQVNIQKTSIYTAPACTSLSLALLSTRSFADIHELFSCSSFNITSGWYSQAPCQADNRPSDFVRFPYIYQNFIGLLCVCQISLHLTELHRSTLCIPDFLTSNRTSLEYFMYTRFPYI